MYLAKPVIVAVGLCLGLSGCGGGDDFGAVGDGADQTPTSADVTPTEPVDGTETEPGDEELPFTVVENCEGEPTEISVGTPVSGELVSGNDLPLPSLFFCVVASGGVTELTIELSGLQVDLDLFSAYGNIEELGGGLALRTSFNSGLEDERIVIDPPTVRGKLGGFEQLEHIIPGAYYIELSGIGFDEATPFTLSVTAS
jgi:hypothetical protein